MSDLFSQLQTAWTNLSQREQVLVGSAAGLAAIAILWYAALAPLLGVASSAASGVTAAEEQLEAMKRLRREYDDVTQRLSHVEKRISAKGQNSNILTLLESLAATSGVKIESMNQRQSANNDVYRETKVEVELKKVTLTQTVDYLHNIESSQQLLSVKSLRLKTRNEKVAPSLMDVTFAVSSFEPL